MQELRLFGGGDAQRAQRPGEIGKELGWTVTVKAWLGRGHRLEGWLIGARTDCAAQQVLGSTDALLVGEPRAGLRPLGPGARDGGNGGPTAEAGMQAAILDAPQRRTTGVEPVAGRRWAGGAGQKQQAAQR